MTNEFEFWNVTRNIGVITLKLIKNCPNYIRAGHISPCNVY